MEAKSETSEKKFRVSAFGRPERGFNRGGHYWPAIGATHDLTQKQLDDVKGERRVAITEVDGKQYKAPPLPPPPAGPKFAFEPAAEKSQGQKVADLTKANEGLKTELDALKASIPDLVKKHIEEALNAPPAASPKDTKKQQ